ncbi:WXG100 family type VII secretion target [Cellulomonas chengniuliangii]|uniref:ESAT-6-like protein n=1 Tax=Cellulomonas chengniuliangii TaxID=2968084 RepID=A0ABY5L1H6_9CELL|nr:WXG100 family type VII secretion target [Cellulomonas chengniuliangii]MCC2307296.1 WXG100 family type VII secretion target [Cellulomonas chengniuliangii]MCC2317808.1 WXG100 family type VII secretion target [Cellulomonas chengniuliangii]UUI75913.1 WXG100 family type VII secretion target [Cellulomonas chengniuliangii]
MSRYEVDSAQVGQAAAAVQARTAAVRSEVGAMQRQLADLQNAWRGGAATAFAGVMTEWGATQVRVEQALDSITAALHAAARTYADAEDQASRLFLR